MCSTVKNDHQAGFSLMELLIAMAIMVLITGAAFALIQGSLKFTTATFNMTDAQQNLRTAQEFINRDLTTSGDGLKSIGTIQVPLGFVTNYLTLAPVLVSGQPNLAIVTTDDDVAGTTAVPQASPAVTVRDKTDRLTLLMQDTTFPTVSLAVGKITFVGSDTKIVVPDATKFRAGEIYAVTSQNSAAFGVISSINNGTNTLTLTNGDVYGLNQTAAGTPIYAVSQGGAAATTIMRIQIIHYFVDSNKHLVRRTFGVSNFAFIDSVIAEHVTDLQFRYLTNLPDANGFVQQPVKRISSLLEQSAVRQVETTITTESTRAVNPTISANGGRQTISSTTRAGIRNMQFRQAQGP
jgi:prepilin-type N-terminal cleavage/methylation domain-containing protein